MLMGMTAEQYWDGDPSMAVAYVRAAQLRKQQTSDDCWLMGAYIFQAVSTVAYNATRDKKKGQKAKPYLDEPYRVIPYTQAEEEARAEKERQRVIEFFNRMAADFDKKDKE